MNPGVRIVHLADYGGPYPGSFVPMIRAANAASAQREWQFEAIFSHGADRHPWYADLRNAGVEASVAPDLGPAAMTHWLRSRWSRAGRLLAHTHFTRFDVPTALAASGRRIPVIWHLHTALLPSPRAIATNIARFTTLGRLTDRILCVGPEIERSALRRGAPRDRTVLLGNGIDLVHLTSLGPDEQAEARAVLGLPPKPPAVLIFARDWEGKGGQLLIDAIAELAPGRQLTAMVVGGGEQAASAAERAGCASSVHSLAFTDDVRILFAACDVLVAPSRSEGMPFAVLEALSLGRPVIASNIPSHRYIGADLPACTLVPRSATAIASAIAERLDEPRDHLSADLRVTRERLSATRSLDRWADAVFGLYDEVLAR